MVDDKFTNKTDIEYPALEDIVDIKVLNNNTKLLDEKKASIESLENVARESNPQAIENAVNNIGNVVGESLEGVAKEKEPYSIEEKVEEMYEWFQEDRTNWAELPNVQGIPIIKSEITVGENVVLDIAGSGNIILLEIDGLANKTLMVSKNLDYASLNIIIIADDKIVFQKKQKFLKNITNSVNYDVYFGNIRIWSKQESLATNKTTYSSQGSIAGYSTMNFLMPNGGVKTLPAHSLCLTEFTERANTIERNVSSINIGRFQALCAFTKSTGIKFKKNLKVIFELEHVQNGGIVNNSTITSSISGVWSLDE